MGHPDIISALLSNRIFRGLDFQQVEEISNLVRKKTYNTGQYLICQGDLASELFIIDHGSVEIIKKDSEGDKEYRIATLVDGDCIGEVTLFDNNPHSTRSASARSLATTDALIIAVEDLYMLMTNSSPYMKLFANFAQELSVRLRRTNENAIDFLKNKITQIDMTQLSAGIKSPPLRWGDREEIIKEAMFFREVNPEAIIVAISDDSMLPFYACNEYVGGRRRTGVAIKKLVGANCIVETIDNGIFVRRLRLSSQPDHYELLAINASYSDQKIIVSATNLAGAAEVIWHRRTDSN